MSHWYFNGMSRMRQACFKASRIILGCFKVVSKVFRMCFKSDFRVYLRVIFQGCVCDASNVFHGCIKGIS